MVVTVTWLTDTEYLSQIITDMFGFVITIRSAFLIPDLSSGMFCNKSNTTCATCGTGTDAIPEHTSSHLFLTCRSGVPVVNVKSHGLGFFVPCCGVHCDFHIKRCSVPLLPRLFWRGSRFIGVFSYVYWCRTRFSYFKTI